MGYSESRFIHNLELASIKDCIHYGCGANSASDKEMQFDYNWNDSKLIATMKNALRALVSGALETKEIIKAGNN